MWISLNGSIWSLISLFPFKIMLFILFVWISFSIACFQKKFLIFVKFFGQGLGFDKKGVQRWRERSAILILVVDLSRIYVGVSLLWPTFSPFFVLFVNNLLVLSVSRFRPRVLLKFSAFDFELCHWTLNLDFTRVCAIQICRLLDKRCFSIFF